MKDFSEIVKKRKATILKKRELKLVKQEAKLKLIDDSIDYLLIKKLVILKRIDTLTKKTLLKI